MRWPVLFLSLTLAVAPLARPSACPEAASGSITREGDGVMRYVEDAALGRTWALLKDRDHPERPGRLVPVARPPRQDGDPEYISGAVTKPEPMLIRAGDPLTLVEETETLHLSLQGVALDGGTRGALVRVRLARGGAVLPGTVLGPGRVAFVPAAAAKSFGDTNRRLP